MPLFTPEIARINAAKGVAQRKLNRDNREKLIKQLLDRPLAPELPQPKPPVEPVTEYASRRLNRVRGQIERLNERIDDLLNDDEVDAGAIDRLANALSRLQDMERIMDGRPLPGSKRPASESKARGFASLNDSIVASEPAPAQPAQPNNPTSLSSDSVNP